MPTREEERKILLDLHRWGHFWNPDFPDCHNVAYLDVPALSLDHPLAKDAVASFQLDEEGNTEANLANYLWRHHGRYELQDSDYGPATADLLNTKRCHFPDYPPPEGADLSGYSEDHIRSLDSYRSWEATGSGSWPAGCLDGWDRRVEYKIPEGVHAIRRDINFSTKPSWLDDWEEVEAWTTARYAEIGLLVVTVPNGHRSEIDQKWRNGAGWIGLAEFNNGTCGDNVFHYQDPGFRASFNRRVSLDMHELGHNCNLPHVRGSGSIMNPVITANNTWIGDPSYSRLKRYFGGEPVRFLDDPDPQPTPRIVGELYGEHVPEKDLFAIRGELAINGQFDNERFIVVPKLNEPGKYIIVRRPEV